MSADPSTDAQADGPDLARVALDRAKAAAARSRLDPGDQERMAAASRRAERRRAQRESTRRGKSDPVTFSAAIDALLAARGWERDASVAAVMGRWASLVGETLAAKCSPVSFTDGELVVAAESTAWATQLRLMAPALRTRLNEQLGAGTVTSIRVGGPIGPARTAGGWRVSGGRGPRDTYG